MTTLNAKAKSLLDKKRAKNGSGKNPPLKSETRVVFSSAPPLRALTKQEVEPGFSGTHLEFKRYAHMGTTRAVPRPSVRRPC